MQKIKYIITLILIISLSSCIQKNTEKDISETKKENNVSETKVDSTKEDTNNLNNKNIEMKNKLMEELQSKELVAIMKTTN
jgi:hypothetical protein